MIIKKTIYPFAWLWSNVFPYSLSHKIKNARDWFYTLWIKNFLGSVGLTSVIKYPCELWGGRIKAIDIGEYNHFSAICGIKIGDGLLTGKFVLNNDNNHGDLSYGNADVPPFYRDLTSKGPIEIGNNVWLGDKVAVLGGVKIGDNVIVGANSVVTRSIPSNCVVAGIPAKIIKELNQ